jgi:UDP-N-acetylglucosamine 1-carboxyvinyltransferase
MADTARIATLITRLRKQHGWTQAQLARKLGTSQSAVTRMEAGRQNLSVEMLERIGKVLGRELVSIGDETVNFYVHGGRKLKGEIETRVSKNASVGLLAASLLNRGTTTLKHVPRIEEVFRVIEVLVSIGVSIRWHNSDLTIKPPRQLHLENIDRKAARKTRSIIMFLAPLMHRETDFLLPFAGGCKLGDRSIRPHIYALEEFGLKADSRYGQYEVKVKKRRPGEVVLYESGDTVTENAVMAAALTPGKTTIKYASANYSVQDLCFYLEQLGVRIEGIGTTTLTVHGKTSINKATTYYPSEDPIESMLFITLAAITRSTLTVQRCPIDFLELELYKLRKMGLRYEIVRRYQARNGRTGLADIKVMPSELIALRDKVEARPYPGINIDNLPFFVPLAAAARGRTLIHDWVYENRAVYYTELNKLGARIDMADIHRVYVNGPTTFTPADITCPPALRPAAIILLAMLAADGDSVLRDVYSINRGYEGLAERLKAIGADIDMA